ASSISAGSTASGVTPIWASRARRLGLALASTSRGAARAVTEAPPGASPLLEPVGDATPGQVVGGHLAQHPVPRPHPAAVVAHLAGGVGDDLVLVVEFHAEGGVGQQLADRARELQQLFFRHSASQKWATRPQTPQPPGSLRDSGPTAATAEG